MIVATIGEWAALIIAVFWALLVFALVALIFSFLKVTVSLREMVDGISGETVPLLHEVGNTVRGVNHEIERVDAIVASVQTIAHNAETVSSTVKVAVTNPLVKALAFMAGAKRATKKMREG